VIIIHAIPPINEIKINVCPDACRNLFITILCFLLIYSSSTNPQTRQEKGLSRKVAPNDQVGMN